MDNQTDGTASAKTAKAIEISKWSMVVFSIWIAELSMLKTFWSLLSATEFGLTMNKILLSGVVLATVFASVYLSLWIDKFNVAFEWGSEVK
jgi:hypothetical protein